MTLPTIRHASPAELDAYGRISSGFRVSSRVDLEALERGVIETRPVRAEVVKGYELSGIGPRLERTAATLIQLVEDGRRIGGAIVARDSAEADLLAGNPEDAVLWDIRIAGDHRRRGLGRMLMGEAERWSRAECCDWLKAETQDINVTACRLYLRCGFSVESITPRAYPDLPDEARIVWAKRLRGSHTAWI